MVSFVSVTLLGTNAPHSAVTRGKPSLFFGSFSSLPGLFEPTFCFVLVLHLVRLWCVLLGFFGWLDIFFGVFLPSGGSLSYLRGFVSDKNLFSVILN